MDKSKITGQSSNPQAELLAKLMREMPEIFSEGKIDSKKLKATLGENVVTDQERYGLTWAGKAECFKKIQETTTSTLNNLQVLNLRLRWSDWKKLFCNHSL